jgi:hypothetical protein
MRLRVAYYYDMTWVPGAGGTHSIDSESQLAQLCNRCAYQAASGELAWAGAAEDDAQCEQCGGYAGAEPVAIEDTVDE